MHTHLRADGRQRPGALDGFGNPGVLCHECFMVMSDVVSVHMPVWLAMGVKVGPQSYPVGMHAMMTSCQ